MFEHLTKSSFWKHYKALPKDIQDIADKQYALLEANPRHPSLKFKPIDDRVWSVRVTQGYRALARRYGSTFVWFWIGSHDEYMRIIR